MTLDQLRQIPDPAARQREAARIVDTHRDLMSEAATIRAQAIRELKVGRTWAQVGAVIGTSPQRAQFLATRNTERTSP